MKENKNKTYLWGSLGTVALLFVVYITFATFVKVAPGTVGVVTHFGAVQDEILPEGLHLVTPIKTNVVPMTVRVQKFEDVATASSKDLQNVTTKVALNFYLSKEKTNIIFQELGPNYHRTIIEPTIQESLKSVTAQFNAEQLITKRSDVKQLMFEMIRERLERSNIIVTDFSIIDFSFTIDFNKAIEEKQIAEQRALRAKNDLNRVKIEAQQAKEKAKGEADAQLELARSEAESQRLIKESLTPDIVQLRAIQKWDGKAPLVISGDSAGSYFSLDQAAHSRQSK
jgi:regulator of protease activity HflC (stomatin/prohibitin superfamily)